MTDWLYYWKSEPPEILDHIAGEQLDHVSTGDTMWIVDMRAGHLTLVGCIEVGRVVTQRVAERALGRSLWKARYHVLAPPGQAESRGSVDLSRLAPRLRFEGPAARLPPDFTGQHLQRMRRLTAASATRLRSAWRTHEAPDSVTLSGRRVSRDAVIEALAEFDRVGREQFLATNGYGPARKYFLVRNGKHYDSKVIFGVACGKANPSLGTLKASDFSGGEATVARRLRDLGFTVGSCPIPADIPSEPLVLVENEATYGGAYDHWQDETGVRYQFPNQYRNLIQQGRRFIYYRGVRRRGGARGEAEYFGFGTIGDVSRDPSIPDNTPKSRWKWFCTIADFASFPNPVLSRVDGKYFETVSQPLGWRTAVRMISEATYRDIINRAGLTPNSATPGGGEIEPPALVLPSITAVRPDVLEDPMVVMLPTKSDLHPTGRGGTGGGASRRSRNAKAVGDRAEEIVLRWLQTHLPPEQVNSLRWVARLGETPGWDIEYKEKTGAKVCVEVKGTTGPAFPSIEITGSEWRAARRMRDRYWLFLVAGCATTTPTVGRIQDPFSMHKRGSISAEPLLWRLERLKGSQGSGS